MNPRLIRSPLVKAPGRPIYGWLSQLRYNDNRGTGPFPLLLQPAKVPNAQFRPKP